ncbi:MAG: DUF1800 domain-containing protein [Candidatus Sulfotelmatobacter sp.]
MSFSMGVLMRPGRAKFTIFLLSVALACVAPRLLARKKDKTAPAENQQKRALHALNRLAFGPRPGDLQQVMAMGVDQWIDLQLHPEKINDGALDTRLAPLRAVRLSTREIAEEFPNPQEIKQVMDGKKSMPSDPARRAMFEVQIARQQQRQERKQEAATSTRPAPASEKEDKAPAENPMAMPPNAAEEPAATPPADDPSMKAADANESANPTGNDNRMASAAAGAAPALTPEEAAEARRREEHLYADLAVEGLLDVPPDQRYKKILSMTAEQQLLFANSLRGGKAQEFLEGMDPKQKETLLAMNNPLGVVTDELMQAKLLRAIYSERQLEEVMTDFWFNHFNIFVGKGADRWLLPSYERDVIRPHALGRFEDLLVATAKSPAMLFYLDNWLSVGPNSMQALGIPPRPYGPYWRHYPSSQRRPNQGKRSSGLNENYGRELLELHTLSVNGGYSQRDVTEVAKVFTGWTIDQPYQGGGFKFEPRMHEPGPKFVLGHRIKPKGEDEALQVLHMLASSPQTAHFISLKLAERFVSDDPPPALVDRMAKTFLKKKGDIREVLTVLFHSPEFWSDDAYRAKVKTPLEFVASTVRATGADVTDTMPLARQLNNLGMPLYGAQPPTGYSMKAETWVSSSALLSRMNFALQLTAGRMRGVKLDSAQLTENGPPAADSEEALAALETSLLAGDVSKQTHDSIVAQIEATGKNGTPQKQDNQAGPRKPDDASRSAEVSTIAGLLLGSPEFQRR